MEYIFISFSVTCLNGILAESLNCVAHMAGTVSRLPGCPSQMWFRPWGGTVSAIVTEFIREMQFWMYFDTEFGYYAKCGSAPGAEPFPGVVFNDAASGFAHGASEFGYYD